MRVISGSLGGRQFVSPAGNRTHPMSDKARGAIFSALGDISNLSVLDAYAGSGALGIEAISRGAASVLAIDNDKHAARTILENATTLGIKSKLSLSQMNISTWCDTSQAQFDIVLADPPYDQLRPDVIAKLVKHVFPGGLLVLSWPGSQLPPQLDDTEALARKEHGDIQVAFYRRLQ